MTTSSSFSHVRISSFFSCFFQLQTELSWCFGVAWLQTFKSLLELSQLFKQVWGCAQRLYNELRQNASLWGLGTCDGHLALLQRSNLKNENVFDC